MIYVFLCIMILLTQNSRTMWRVHVISRWHAEGLWGMEKEAGPQTERLCCIF